MEIFNKELITMMGGMDIRTTGNLTIIITTITILGTTIIFRTDKQTITTTIDKTATMVDLKTTITKIGGKDLIVTAITITEIGIITITITIITAQTITIITTQPITITTTQTTAMLVTLTTRATMGETMVTTTLTITDHK